MVIIAVFKGKFDFVCQAFTDVVGPLISNPTHMKTMVGCMNVILSNSTLPVKVFIYTLKLIKLMQGVSRSLLITKYLELN